MKLICCCIFILLFADFIFCQKQNNIWYFGNNAGLNFNSGSPVALTDGKVNTFDCSSTVSDANGNLLFYTDGVTVYTKQHTIMQNGENLAGNYSSTQSALIIPKPTYPNIYYIFTTDYIAGSKGFEYSVVDLSYNNGLGKVIEKNHLLVTPTGEKIAATWHKNGVDIWVVTHKFYSNEFYAYLINSSGVSTYPIISSIGTSHTGDINNACGQLTFSSDGSYLANAAYTDSFFELFDFDNNLGLVSNPVKIADAHNSAYAVEFSNDNSKLYCATIREYENGKIYQFNLNAGTAQQIIDSKTLVATVVATGRYQNGTLQLGPDKKIYTAKCNNDYLGVINYPDSLGLKCQYVDNAVYLGGKKCLAGLSSFLQPYQNVSILCDFTFLTKCASLSTIFNLTTSVPCDSVRWTFNDINSGQNNTSNQLNPEHIFSSAGQYTINIMVYKNGYQTTFSKTIEILMPLYVNIGKDTTICNNQSYLLNATTSNATYLWNNGAYSPTITINTSGLYWVEVTKGNCKVRDSILINTSLPLEINIGRDTAICSNNNIVLDATNQGAIKYEWNNGNINSSITVINSGIYWVDVSSEFCTTRDSILINTINIPNVNLGNDTLLCDDNFLTLFAISDSSTYLWQDGDNLSIYNVTNKGIYYVTVSNRCGIDTDTIQIWYETTPYVNIGNNYSICQGDSVILDAYFLGANYNWSNGSTDSVYWANKSETVTVQISNICGAVFKAIEVKILPVPSINLGNDTLLCDDYFLMLFAISDSSTYLWQDGSNLPYYNITSNGIYYVTVSNRCGIDTDTIKVRHNITPFVNLGDNFSICKQDSVMLNASFLGANYNWSNGSTDSIYWANKSETIKVKVSNECGSTFDTIIVKMITAPNINLGKDTLICSEINLNLSVNSDEATYLWQNGNTQPKFTINTTGLYYVEVENKCGKDIDSILVTSDNLLEYIELPNIFTPNEDSKNDILKINLPNYKSFEVYIYNQWGQQLVKSNNPENIWDGNYNGKEATTGVYYYLINISTDIGCEYNFKEVLNLYR